MISHNKNILIAQDLKTEFFLFDCSSFEEEEEAEVEGSAFGSADGGWH
jgi:hypothetical protein